MRPSDWAPSGIDMGPGRSLELRRVAGALYELRLVDRSRVVFRVNADHGDFQRLTLDMEPLERERVRLAYVSRHVMVELDGELRCRVPDVLFMQLVTLASEGAGERVDARAGPSVI